jgi:hypothetical protein
MLEKTIEDSYRAYHIDAAGKRVEHTTFMACEDGAACDNALSLQEKGGWPAMELWVRHRKVSCEAGSADTPREVATDPDAAWGRRIDASAYRHRAEALGADADAINDRENKQTMLKLANNYEQWAKEFTLRR